MCTGLELGLALSALGSGAKAVNSMSALKKQDRQAATGIQQQAVRQREATQRVGQTLDQTAQSDGATQRAASDQAFMDALRKSAAGIRGGQGIVPNADARFATDTAAAGKQTGDYGSKLAGLFAGIDAPTQQRTDEGVAARRAASDVGQIQRNAEGDDFVNRLRLAAIKPNPWISAGAGIAQNVGTGLAIAGASPDGMSAGASRLLRNPGADPTIVDRLRRMQTAGQVLA